MLSKDNKFSPGMKYEDFDITFSSFEAVNKEILHTLIIVPNRYDQNSKFCQFPRTSVVFQEIFSYSIKRTCRF